MGSERADGRADCKQKKKERKGKKKNDSLLFRACGWACGRVADGRAWMGLRADVNGCKQRKGERKKKKNGLTAGGGHERAVRTLFEVFEHCQTRTNCSNSVRTAHHRTAGCSNSVRTVGNECIISPNTVRTVFGQHAKQWVMFEHCSNTSNSAKQGQTVRTVFEQHTTARRAVRTRFKQLEVGV